MKIINSVKKMYLNRGSTLIELIIAVMVVGLILTAVANAVTHSVKNTGEARFKQVATVLAQEIMENVRSEKNRVGMINLKNALISESYCFPAVPGGFNSTPPIGECNDEQGIEMAGTEFFRNAYVVNSGVGISNDPNDPYSMTVTVVVSWYDSANLKSVELIQEFQESY
jgi:prepilin-type N-terminal cleavage/methylation domain-containing protein